MTRLLVCAWCNKPKPKIKLLTASRTHGICEACSERIFGLKLWQIPVQNFPIRKVTKTPRDRTTTFAHLRPKAEDFHVR